MSQESEPIDHVEEMLRRTGCIELHYKVQECIAEKRDWRKCQEEVQKKNGKGDLSDEDLWNNLYIVK
ncbi:hypothetical protein GE061_010286 [Apolygus lucorum]|uniref:Coiled-coil-helix-coiled-coil-helix domain-containing protein 8 n=1 Tax=Apolygus lucorum TaxID=248454 RepID=A0A8S9Y2N0_APOLU|nr:hypothetical protein GE061_010286 [Apolygus lucorum]